MGRNRQCVIQTPRLAVNSPAHMNQRQSTLVNSSIPSLDRNLPHMAIFIAYNRRSLKRKLFELQNTEPPFVRDLFDGEPCLQWISSEVTQHATYLHPHRCASRKLGTLDQEVYILICSSYTFDLTV